MDGPGQILWDSLTFTLIHRSIFFRCKARQCNTETISVEGEASIHDHDLCLYMLSDFVIFTLKKKGQPGWAATRPKGRAAHPAGWKTGRHVLFSALETERAPERAGGSRGGWRRRLGLSG
jgi:hypothetical protein